MTTICNIQPGPGTRSGSFDHIEPFDTECLMLGLCQSRIGSIALPCAPMDWTRGQAEALEAFEQFLLDPSVKVFLLRGPAGTGKSELIAKFVRVSHEMGWTTQVLAPTGQAARRLAHRIGGNVQTIHSAIFVRSGNTDNGEDVPPTAEFTINPERPSVMMSIIDEASLVGDSVVGPIDQKPAVRFGSGRLLSDLLEYSLADEGKVVFVGDPSQLPAFGEEHAVALDESVFAARGLRVLEVDIDEIVRQVEGSSIAALGREIRESKSNGSKNLPTPIFDDRELLHLTGSASAQVLSDLSAQDGVVIAWRNADVAVWNRRIRESLGMTDSVPRPGDRLVMVQAAPSVNRLNGDEIIVRDVRSIETVHLRDESVDLIDCDVEFVDTTETVAFSVLIVAELLESSSSEQLRRITRLLWIDLVRRLKEEGIQRSSLPGEFWERAEVDRRWNSLRATYAYARTAFRAQGGEWSTVLFDGTGLRSAAGHGHSLAYTAVTRARSKLYLRRWPSLSSHREVDPSEMARQLESLSVEVTGRTLSASVINPKSPAVQITDPGEGRFSANVYLSRGLPSRVDVQKGNDLDWSRVWKDSVEEWVFHRSAEARPAPEEVIEYLASALNVLRFEGVDVLIWSEGDYLVGIEITQNERCHRGAYYHSAIGKLTKRASLPRRMPPSSDESLQAVFESLCL